MALIFSFLPPLGVLPLTSSDRAAASSTCRQHYAALRPPRHHWPLHLRPKLLGAAADGDRAMLLRAAELLYELQHNDECEIHLSRLVEVSRGQLTVEERNLHARCFSHVTGSRRASLRVLDSIIAKERDKPAGHSKVHLAEAYRQYVLRELQAIVHREVQQHTAFLIPAARGAADKMYFYSRVARCHRTLNDFGGGEHVRSAAEAALAAGWQQRFELAATHPSRLGFALNYSAQLYDHGKVEEACAMAKEAFDAAFRELDTLGEEACREATLLMQLLRDNLILWTDAVPPLPDAGGRSITGAMPPPGEEYEVVSLI